MTKEFWLVLRVEVPLPPTPRSIIRVDGVNQPIHGFMPVFATEAEAIAYCDAYLGSPVLAPKYQRIITEDTN